jgi:hypothetical protein
MFTRTIRATLLTLATGVGLTLAAAAAPASLTTALAASTADLPAPTGTDPVTGTGAGAGTGMLTLTGIRVGRHDAYDRTVFDFTGGTPSYRVEFGTLYHQARDEAIPVAGNATLVVVLSGLSTNDSAHRTLNPEFPTLRQVKSGGAFEGYAGFGLGLRDRVGFRVFTLHGPDRLVVDVAHQPTQSFRAAAFRYDGSAAEASVERVRSGRHPGYDRAVFDLRGADMPRLAVGYVGSGSTIRVTFTALGSPGVAPHASFSGPQSYRIGLPALRTVSLTAGGAGVLTADIGTAGRHGFRVLLLGNPTRVAVDIRL